MELEAKTPNFNTFDLHDMPPRGVYGLADGLLPEMAHVIGYEIAEYPTQAALQGLVKQYEYAWILKNRMKTVRQRLNTPGPISVRTIASHWTERSGILEPVDRPYISASGYDQDGLTDFDRTIILSSTGRGMAMQLSRLERLVSPSEGDSGGKANTGKIHLVASSRRMNVSEHSWVADFVNTQGKLPDESDFAVHIMLPKLASLGLEADLTTTKGVDAKQVALAAAQKIEKTDKVLLVTNAPIAMRSASRLRLAARERFERFDASHSQLHVISDSLKNSEGKKGEAYKMPPGLLGHIARTALAIYQNR